MVLPAPLGPTSPIFSPRFTAAEASRNRIWSPCRFETASIRITSGGARRASRTARARGRPASARRAALPPRSSRARARGARARCARPVPRSRRCAHRRCRRAAAPAGRCSSGSRTPVMPWRAYTASCCELLAARLRGGARERERGAARRVLLLVVVHLEHVDLVALEPARGLGDELQQDRRADREVRRAHDREPLRGVRDARLASRRRVRWCRSRAAGRAPRAASSSASVDAGEEKSTATSAGAQAARTSAPSFTSRATLLAERRDAPSRSSAAPSRRSPEASIARTRLWPMRPQAPTTSTRVMRAAARRARLRAGRGWPSRSPSAAGAASRSECARGSRARS